MSVDLGPALADPFLDVDLGGFSNPRSGKIRELCDVPGGVALVTTDRISAFDRVLGAVPYRGQLLNQLAAFWFEQLADIVANHVLAVPDPNVTIGRRCAPLPVEVVVRARLTGVTDTSIWTRYARGERTIYGIDFPEGMVKNDMLPEPIITPTTKASSGEHDLPLTSAQVVEDGLVEQRLWDRVCDTALALFERGQRIAAEAGLVLVDTKYELGLDDRGELVLIDEVHTPDSSRYWVAATLDDRLARGDEPESRDKELVRQRYVTDLGYAGEGPVPPLPADLAVDCAEAYIESFERLTGRAFEPASWPPGPRVIAAIQRVQGDGA